MREGLHSGQQEFGILNVAHASLEGVHGLQLLAGGTAALGSQRLHHIAELLERHPHTMDRRAIGWSDGKFTLNHPVEGHLDSQEGFGALLLLYGWRIRKRFKLSHSTSNTFSDLAGFDALQLHAEALRRLAFPLRQEIVEFLQLGE